MIVEAAVFENLAELLEAHGVLDFFEMPLVSISTETIAPSRFALPAEPLELSDVMAAAAESGRTEDEDAPRQPSIISATYHDQMLLVLRDDGKIESWAEGTTESKAYQTPGFVGSFCQVGENTYLATFEKQKKPSPYGQASPPLGLR